jgi:hypothetical protein
MPPTRARPSVLRRGLGQLWLKPAMTKLVTRLVMTRLVMTRLVMTRLTRLVLTRLVMTDFDVIGKRHD